MRVADLPPLPPFPFDRYVRYDELSELLQAVAKARPDLVAVASIGQSWEGREIWCATVTRFATGPAAEKPAVYADGNLHATEVSPTTACLYLLHKLVSGYGEDEAVTRALDTRAFYVLPRVNPDGAELYLSDPARVIRSSTRPYPFDEDPLDGLKRGDIDGDGRILQMRLPDPNGAWKRHADAPRVMVRRDAAETGGSYFRLLPEGRLLGYDGATFALQPNKEGLDLNRNFPSFWRPESEQRGAGPYPTSEPETRAIAAFLTRHKNICMAVAFHTYSGVLVRPYGTEPDSAFPVEDLRVYEAIGRKGTELTGYPACACFRDFKFDPKKTTTGVFDDWCYDHLGILAWTDELWCAQRQAGITDGFDAATKPGAFRFTTWDREHTVAEDLKLIEWADTHLDGKGYHDWRPFDHPDLGPVEIGGWDGMYAFENPPPTFLETEVAPHADWLIWQALITPKLELVATEVVALGDGAYRILLAVQNTGYLPTYVTKKAIERKAVRPLIAEITLPEGATLVTGKPWQELTQLEGRAGKSAGNSGTVADTTDDRVKCEWVVRAKPGTKIALLARHERAGVVRAEVVCP